MTKTTNTRAATLCKKLNAAFPECNAVTYDQWNGDNKVSQDGIWFRQEGGEAPDGAPLFNYWEEFSPRYHPKLEALVTRYGFHLEPYDAGTLMAFRA